MLKKELAITIFILFIIIINPTAVCADVSEHIEIFDPKQDRVVKIVQSSKEIGNMVVDCIHGNSNNNELKQESELETYKNLFTTLLYPYVDKAIEEFYSEYLKYPPREDLFFYNFLSIIKNPEHNYSYTIKLEVQPFVGPHLSVGLDHITLKIDLSGVNVERYEHLKNYELPSNYEGIFKKKLPNQAG